jgi:hypothetical protein
MKQLQAAALAAALFCAGAVQAHADPQSAPYFVSGHVKIAGLPAEAGFVPGLAVIQFNSSNFHGYSGLTGFDADVAISGGLMGRALWASNGRASMPVQFIPDQPFPNTAGTVSVSIQDAQGRSYKGSAPAAVFFQTMPAFRYGMPGSAVLSIHGGPVQETVEVKVDLIPRVAPPPGPGPRPGYVPPAPPVGPPILVGPGGGKYYNGPGRGGM